MGHGVRVMDLPISVMRQVLRTVITSFVATARKPMSLNRRRVAETPMGPLPMKVIGGRAADTRVHVMKQAFRVGNSLSAGMV